MIGPWSSIGSPRGLTTRPTIPSPTGTLQQLAGGADGISFFDAGVVAQHHDADGRFLEVERDALDAVLEFDHLAGHEARQAVDASDAVADLEHSVRLQLRVISGENASISRWMTELISSALNFMRLSFDQSLAKLCEPALGRRVVTDVADLDHQAGDQIRVGRNIEDGCAAGHAGQSRRAGPSTGPRREEPPSEPGREPARGACPRWRVPAGRPRPSNRAARAD